MHAKIHFKIIAMISALGILLFACTENQQASVKATSLGSVSGTSETIYSTGESQKSPTIIPATATLMHSQPSQSQLAPTQTIKPTNVVIQPSLTPLPKFDLFTMGRIAFTILGGYETGDAYITAGDNNLVSILSGLANSHAVEWSPDGHWLVLDATYTTDFRSELYLAKLDGTEIKRLTYPPYEKSEASWSPDGKWIAYVEWSGSSDICVVNIEGNDYRKLTFTPEIESSPVWSPDGRQIAFLQLAEGENEGDFHLVWALMVMDSDASNLREITELRAGPGRIDWSPDGSQITFSSPGACGDIYVINVKGSEPKNLTENLDGCAKNPTWSPDGEYIAFNLGREQGNLLDGEWKIYVIHADGSNAAQILTGSGWVPLRPDWSPVPALLIDGTYTISGLGDKINLREAPAVNGAVLLQLHVGDIVKVLEGPNDADDYYWWKLRAEDGTEGWAVEVAGWYQPLDE